MKKRKEKQAKSEPVPAMEASTADAETASAEATEVTEATETTETGEATEATETSGPTEVSVTTEASEAWPPHSFRDAFVDPDGVPGGLPETVVGDDDITNRVELVDAELSTDDAVSDEAPPVVEGPRLESILESMLFAADRPLGLTDLKRLLGDRDGRRLSAALEALRERRADSGVQLVSVAGAWQLRTHPNNGAWVSKLVAGRPPRLSRAMMETLSIIAYRQPITRPEIDEIRGVDCGPVLRTLLDRALIRVLGKREEVGRPMLYGTTPEFLKTFSLRDLTELPTLREFHELGADDRAKVDAQAAETLAGDGPLNVGDLVGAGQLPDVDPEEEDRLIDALDQATHAAGHATRSATEPNVEPNVDVPDGETAPAPTEAGGS